MIGNTKKNAVELRPEVTERIQQYAQRDSHVIVAPPYYVLPVELAEAMAVNPSAVKAVKAVDRGVRRCWAKITEIVTRIISKAQAIELAPKILLTETGVHLGNVKVGACQRYALMGPKEEVEKLLSA